MLGLGPIVLVLGLAVPVYIVGAQSTAFVDVTVVDVGSGRLSPHRTVLVSGGRISRVANVDSITVDSAVQRVDGKGRFLMPGFADMQ